MPTSRRNQILVAVGVLGVLLVVVLFVLLTGGPDDGRQAAGTSPTAGVTTATSTPVPTSGSPSTTPSAQPPASGTGAPSTPPRGVQTTGAPAITPVGTPSVAISTAAATQVGKAAPILPGVAVTVTSVKAVTVKSEQPGQVAGPAVAVTVSVKNSSGGRFSLSGLVVNVSYGPEAAPGSQTEASPSKVLTGTLAAQKSATGVYVFNVPAGQAGTVRVTVSSDRSPTILEFVQ